jgi:hypothetical protein
MLAFALENGAFLTFDWKTISGNVLFLLLFIAHPFWSKS